MGAYFNCFCFRKSPGESGGDLVPTPAARPSLRDMHSPQQHAKSTIEEDLKRHSAHDTPPPPRKHKEKVLSGKESQITKVRFVFELSAFQREVVSCQVIPSVIVLLDHNM